MLTFHTEPNHRTGQPLTTLKKYVFDLFKMPTEKRKNGKIASFFSQFTKQKDYAIPIEQIYKKLRKREEQDLKDILDSGLAES